MRGDVSGQRRSARLNVVCVVVDTLRYDVVHHTCPYADVHLPNLDALRRESIDFSAAFGEGEPTIPVRRALWTGIRSFPWRYDLDTTGVWPVVHGWHQIPPHQPTLAETLLAEGYRTALISDVWHMFKPTMNFTRGWLTWDFVRGQEADNWRSGPLSQVRDEAKRYIKHELDPSRDAILLQYLFNKRAFARDEPLTSGTVLRTAIDWLDANHDEGPFLLWIEAFDPHEPWDPPREYADRYCPDFAGTEFIFPGMGAQHADRNEQDRTRALYFGEVTYVDEWIGKLLNHLADLGHLDDTVVIFLSDHGTELMDHGQFGKTKQALHGYTTQLNWVVRHPGLPGGRTVDEFVGNHDLFATVLDILDVPEPERDLSDQTFAGQSVLPLLRAAAGKSANSSPSRPGWQNRDYALTGWDNYAAIRSKTWNYIVNFERPEENPRLFDLRTDPAERHNVLSDHPDVAALHRQELERLLGDSLPVKLPDLDKRKALPCQTYYSQNKHDSAVDQFTNRQGARP